MSLKRKRSWEGGWVSGENGGWGRREDAGRSARYRTVGELWSEKEPVSTVGTVREVRDAEGRVRTVIVGVPGELLETDGSAPPPLKETESGWSSLTSESATGSRSKPAQIMRKWDNANVNVSAEDNSEGKIVSGATGERSSSLPPPAERATEVIAQEVRRSAEWILGGATEQRTSSGSTTPRSGSAMDAVAGGAPVFPRWCRNDELGEPVRRRSKRGLVNLYGIVVDGRCGHDQRGSFQEQRLQRHSVLLLIDESVKSFEQALRVDHYTGIDGEPLPLRAVGDIVRLHELHVRRVQNATAGRTFLQAKCLPSTSLLLFSSEVCSSFVPLAASGPKDRRHAFCNSDRARIRQLRRFIVEHPLPSWATCGVPSCRTAPVARNLGFRSSFTGVARVATREGDRFVIEIEPHDPSSGCSTGQKSSIRFNIPYDVQNRALKDVPPLPCGVVIHPYHKLTGCWAITAIFPTVLWLDPGSPCWAIDSAAPLLETAPLLEKATPALDALSADRSARRSCSVRRRKRKT